MHALLTLTVELFDIQMLFHPQISQKDLLGDSADSLWNPTR